MKTNKWIWGVLAILLGVGMGTAGAATNDVSALLQQGLFEEEANQNLDAAIQAYQAVIGQTEKNRQFAATAIFRLGECYRKEGKTNEAGAQYQRILREFSDQSQLAKLSQQNLAGMGMSGPGPTATPAMSDAALQTQKQLLEEEIKVVEQQVQSQQARVNQGVLSSDELSNTQRQLLELKRQLAALESGQPVPAATSTATDAEDAELQRIQSMMQNTPDLITGSSGELASAAEAGYLRVTAFLLEHGANVNGSPPDYSPLIHAALRDQKTMVELLLNRGADINARDSSGETALFIAAENGYKSVAEVLLSRHADVNIKRRDGHTSLHIAARNDHMDIASLLITNGADVNTADGEGWTPLHVAARMGNTVLMQLLIDHKATVDARNNDNGTPLLVAANNSQVAAAALLLKNGADVNAKQESTGWMPLHIAVDGSQPELVKLLLENGADPNARIPSYHPRTGGLVAGFAGYYPQGADATPLVMAVMNGNAEIAKLLIAHHADVNAKDADGNTALIWVALNPRNQSGGPQLGGGLGGFGGGTGFGGGRPVPVNQVKIPSKDQLDMAELLLDNGADVNAQNQKQDSSLGLAVNKKLPDLVKLLLQHQAKVDILDNNGWTPLEWAVPMQAADIAGLLLDAGANPNVKISSDNGNWLGLVGRTLLGMAVVQTDKPMVEALLSHKADPNLPDDKGETPLSYARQISQNTQQDTRVAAEITELLLKAGANDNLHRLSTISVSRNVADYAGGNYTETVFLKGTNSFNHYSLFELLAAFYAPPLKSDPDAMPGLAFPDFGNIKISRLQKDGLARLIPLDAETALAAGDCSGDVPLEWGDMVEIPESDHKVGETWGGLTDKERQTLWKCLGGRVTIVVKGQTNTVLLNMRFFHPSERGLGDAYSYDVHYPTGFDQLHGEVNENFPRVPGGSWSFWLYDVVHDANVILTSSDLSRVKVTRRDETTRKTIEMTLNIQKSDPANALWLRDGDVIEIPEKP